MTTNSHWHILGAGSMGCLWAGKLLKKGMQTTVIVRNSRQNTSTLKLTNLDGIEHSWSVDTETACTLSQPIEHLLLCTKAQDAFEALQSVAGNLSENCQIYLMQNGMGSQQQIARTFDQHAVFAASTTEGAWLKAPFDVCHAGRGSTWFGAMNDKARKCQNHAITSLSDSVVQVNNIEEKLWDKLAINCAINGLTALYDCKNGQLLDSEKYKSRLHQLIREVTQIREALNILSTGCLTEIVEEVCQATAANHSSSCMDARLGRKTELAFINGYLIEQAKQLTIEIPENQRLMAELQQKGIRW